MLQSTDTAVFSVTGWSTVMKFIWAATDKTMHTLKLTGERPRTEEPGQTSEGNGDHRLPAARQSPYHRWKRQ